MKCKELLDYTLRELLEDYKVIVNLECGYYYGITSTRDCDKVFKEYNILEEYSEAFSVEDIINDELNSLF